MSSDDIRDGISASWIVKLHLWKENNQIESDYLLLRGKIGKNKSLQNSTIAS